MAYSPIHRFCYFNGQKREVGDFSPMQASGGVYEVLRIYDGIPLFLEDHLERFETSALLAGRNVRYNSSRIAGFITALIRDNEVSEGNILIWSGDALLVCFVPHNYPGAEWYETGVHCGILKAERDNPKAKVFQTSVRQMADEMMAKQGFYEVLLVDRAGRITEGSRSNLFFVKNEQLFTPKAGDVLSGITRKKIISLAQNQGIEVNETDVFLSEISQFQAAFLSGTSPKILPVSQVSDLRFNPKNSLVRQLMEDYDKLIAGYIRERK